MHHHAKGFLDLTSLLFIVPVFALFLVVFGFAMIGFLVPAAKRPRLRKIWSLVAASLVLGLIGLCGWGVYQQNLFVSGLIKAQKKEQELIQPFCALFVARERELKAASSANDSAYVELRKKLDTIAPGAKFCLGSVEDGRREIAFSRTPLFDKDFNGNARDISVPIVRALHEKVQDRWLFGFLPIGDEQQAQIGEVSNKPCLREILTFEGYQTSRENPAWKD